MKPTADAPGEWSGEEEVMWQTPAGARIVFPFDSWVLILRGKQAYQLDLVAKTAKLVKPSVVKSILRHGPTGVGAVVGHDKVIGYPCIIRQQVLTSPSGGINRWRIWIARIGGQDIPLRTEDRSPDGNLLSLSEVRSVTVTSNPPKGLLDISADYKVIKTP